MGWWNSDRDGMSFAPNSEMLWGDAPADAMCDALEIIIREFQQEWGRVPTMEELISGLKFSAPGMLEEAEASLSVKN